MAQPNRGPPAQRQPQNEILAWYNQIPPVTRLLFSATILFTVVGRLYNPSKFLLDWALVIRKLQVWRVVTCFFIHAPNLNFLFDLVFLYKYSDELERASFLGRTGDYAWFVVVVSGVLLLADYVFEFVVLGQALIMAVVYLWAQQNAHVTVNFMFGARFKAVYLPWAMFILHCVSSNGRIPYDELAGIGASHIYHFVQNVYPTMNPNAPRYLATPAWFSSFLGMPNRNIAGFAPGGGVRMHDASGSSTGASAGGSGAMGRRTWGAGQRLGSG